MDSDETKILAALEEIGEIDDVSFKQKDIFA